MFKSIRWRFILVYFMLVFIGMVISGVFIIKSYEVYNLNIVSARLDGISELLTPKLSDIGDLRKNKKSVETLISNYKSIGLREEIYVYDKDYSLIATSNDSRELKSEDIISAPLIVAAMKGQESEDNVSDNVGGKTLRTKDKAYPVSAGGSDAVGGVLYMRYDLQEIYKSLDMAKMIIVQATVLALTITVILGFFISKSVTEPINDVTKKAKLMADGDFDQHVDVRSDDEIGKLGEMFNFLTRELKSSVSEISSEKKKLEAIINNMEDGLIAIDPLGFVVHMNPNAKRMLGIEGKVDNIGDIDAMRHFISLESIFEKSVDLSGHIQMDTGGKMYKLAYVPFRNDKDDIAGLVFVMQDITEQDRLERMRREFVANVSHELKTPLTSIRTYTETVLSGMVDDEDTKREFLGVVVSEADRMTRLVRDLLQLSQFDSQKVVLDIEGYDYAHLVKGCIQKVEVQAVAKGQDIICDIHDGPLVGYFDVDRIEQVLINVLSNAIKYTNDGGTIRVSLERHADSARITVMDNGMGIPKDDIRRLFERFYRVDKARSRTLGGTGLGLSIAKEIIDAHNGDIVIESEVGAGTTVVVTLPLDDGVMSI